VRTPPVGSHRESAKQLVLVFAFGHVYLHGRRTKLENQIAYPREGLNGLNVDALLAPVLEDECHHEGYWASRAERMHETQRSYPHVPTTQTVILTHRASFSRASSRASSRSSFRSIGRSASSEWPIAAFASGPCHEAKNMTIAASRVSALASRLLSGSIAFRIFRGVPIAGEF
jgi:hypothetical protein